jgi:hypothetical protein
MPQSGSAIWRGNVDRARLDRSVALSREDYFAIAMPRMEQIAETTWQN